MEKIPVQNTNLTMCWRSWRCVPYSVCNIIVHPSMQRNKIVVDTVLITGSLGNPTQKALSFATGKSAYAFELTGPLTYSHRLHVLDWISQETTASFQRQWLKQPRCLKLKHLLAYVKELNKDHFLYEHNRTIMSLSLIHIWRCRRSTLCRSRWSPYH